MRITLFDKEELLFLPPLFQTFEKVNLKDIEKIELPLNNFRVTIDKVQNPRKIKESFYKKINLVNLKQ